MHHAGVAGADNFSFIISGLANGPALGGKLNCQRWGAGRLTPSRPEGAIIICSFGVHQTGGGSPSPSLPPSLALLCPPAAVTADAAVVVCLLTPLTSPVAGRSGFPPNYGSAEGTPPTPRCHSNSGDCLLNRNKRRRRETVSAGDGQRGKGEMFHSLRHRFL